MFIYLFHKAIPFYVDNFFCSLIKEWAYKNSYLKSALPLAFMSVSTTKIIIVDYNKRNLNQEAFYLGKDQIERTHEYKYARVNLSHQIKGPWLLHKI